MSVTINDAGTSEVPTDSFPLPILKARWTKTITKVTQAIGCEIDYHPSPS